MIDGERNSRYFHLSLAAKQRRNTILRLKDGDDNWTDKAMAMETIILRHYKKLFCTTQNDDLADAAITIPSFNHADRRWLNRPVQEAEVEQAIFQMGAYKAPGPDGYPPIFYQRNWHIIGPEVVSFVMAAFKNQCYPPGMNETLVTLIPKGNNPDEASKFRPIALMNVIVKVITKIIANRLKAIIGKIISPTQCAFIPGRQAADNIIIAQELMHTMRTKTGYKGLMAVKLDLEKAYDKVRWKYLEAILMKVGFSRELTNLIMFTITSSSLSILWNGKCLEAFRPQRGIRQGDPLAPYLFLLCMESLSQAITQAEAEGSWRPVRTSIRGPRISHLFFADDLLLFGEATAGQAAVMESIIRSFCHISGQTLSVSKSQVYMSKNVPMHFQPAAFHSMGLTRTTDLGIYLGMPLLTGRSSRQTYATLLDKIHAKLGAWKSKTLSQAARYVLIRSVLSLIPTYAMQTVCLPYRLIDEVEKTMRKFLWGDTASSRSLHWVKWSKICQDISQGGLGIKRLRLMNQAMLAKLGWKLINNVDALWVRVLRCKYGDVLQNRKRSNVSLVWRHLRSIVPFLRDGIEFCSGPSATNAPQPRWKGTSSGVFSVASAYHLLTKDTHAQTSYTWDNIWALKGPCRLNFLLWKLCHNAIPVGKNLQKHHVPQNICCQVCGHLEEDSLHTIRDCTWARQIWQLLLRRQDMHRFCSSKETAQWVEMNLKVAGESMHRNNHWPYVFREAVASIWYWRNQKVHGSITQFPPPRCVRDEILCRVNKLLEAHNCGRDVDLPNVCIR